MKEESVETNRYVSFGDALKRVRKQKGIHQQELAIKLGVHRNTISKWERGDCLPDSKTMVLELAKQLRLHEHETHLLLEASLTAISSRWSVPYQRNPFFTGRDEILQHLHEMLCQEQPNGHTRSYALSGLGGIGKTQMAIEYAYRNYQEYTAVLWIRADTYQTIISSFIAITDVLDLPERQEKDHGRIVAAVTQWLTSHRDWLLIFDNVEDTGTVRDFLPAARSGSLLLTTRKQALGTLASNIEIKQMTVEEGMRFLLCRAKLLCPGASPHQLSSIDCTAARAIAEVIDGFPLALDQAGAYIEETGCGLSEYFERFQTRRAILLSRRGSASNSHPQSVFTTLSLSLEQVEQTNLLAADLLRLCAFLHPDAIPEELVAQQYIISDTLSLPVPVDALLWDEAIAILRQYSLIRRDPEAKTLTLHRLVQAVLKDRMDQETQCRWAERGVQAIDRLFPDIGERTKWPLCQRYLPHAHVAVNLPAHWRMTYQTLLSYSTK